jgi:hypothetical protein
MTVSVTPHFDKEHARQAHGRILMLRVALFFMFVTVLISFIAHDRFEAVPTFVIAMACSLVAEIGDRRLLRLAFERDCMEAAEAKAAERAARTFGQQS